MIKDIIIVGCGGLGIETAQLIRDINNSTPSKQWRFLGYVDDCVENHGKTILGDKVLGSVDIIKDYENVNVVIAIADPEIRASIAKKIQDYCTLPTLIHPSVEIPESTTIARGCIIFKQAVISVLVTIGEFVIISPLSGIGHGAMICSFNTILWNVTIGGDTLLMPHGFYGSGSTVIQGIIVEPYCKIGAGAVVIKKVKAHSTMVGVPAKKVK